MCDVMPSWKGRALNFPVGRMRPCSGFRKEGGGEGRPVRGSWPTQSPPSLSCIHVTSTLSQLPLLHSFDVVLDGARWEQAAACAA